jgi:type IV pilus assembly protein PilV
MSMKNRKHWRLQAGLSMIEVLVSLTLVAFGVLGLLGLQARALSFQRDSFDRRAAAEMVAQLAERMRANHLGLTSGFYAPPTAAFYDSTTPTPVAITSCAVPTACSATELAFRDWNQWIAEYRQRSPGSAAYLDWDPADPRRIIVSVGWPEPQNTLQADPICTEVAGRLGVVIPINYRCFTTSVFP